MGENPVDPVDPVICVQYFSQASLVCPHDLPAGDGSAVVQTIEIHSGGELISVCIPSIPAKAALSLLDILRSMINPLSPQIEDAETG